MVKKEYSETPVEVTKDNIDNLKLKYGCYQKVYFKCDKCGAESNKALKGIKDFLCRKCLIEKTAIEKYGSLEEMQRLNLEHGRITKKEKYGDEYFTNREKAVKTSKDKFGNNYNNRSKCKKTLKEKYGVENCSQIEDISEKVKETKFEKYGNENYNNSEKYKETCLKKYGVENISQVEDIKNKVKNTCLEKYGVDNPMKLSSVKDKSISTCLEKYDAEYYLLSDTFKNFLIEKYGTSYPPSNKYIYNDVRFDSSWELYYWIYCEDHNIDIKRCNKSIKYIYNGKEHEYFPDFEVNGELVEIKGNQFFKEDGTMQNPFDHTLDELFEAKHQCMINNNVKILQKSDLIDIINYVNIMYSEDYVDFFRM